MTVDTNKLIYLFIHLFIYFVLFFVFSLLSKSQKTPPVVNSIQFNSIQFTRTFLKYLFTLYIAVKTIIIEKQT